MNGKKPNADASKITGSAFIQSYLEDARGLFEAGDRRCVLRAIQWSFLHNIAVPPWAAKHFNQAVDDFMEMRFRCFDEALGLPKPPKSKHINTHRQKLELAVPVWLRVRQLRDAPRQKKLRGAGGVLERVAEEFGIAKTTARKYCDWVDALSESYRNTLLIRFLSK
jgi:hypothetical protein